MTKDRKQPLPTIDLLKHCRDADVLKTTITMHWDRYDHEFTWMILGQIQLYNRESHHFRHLWVLDAYLGDHTDFEHDSAHIVRIELIGVRFSNIRYGQTTIEAFINPNLEHDDSFSVPTEGYDPLKGAIECETCQEEEGELAKHLMVVEGHYVPPDNRGLYELVRGKRIEIRTGLKR